MGLFKSIKKQWQKSGIQFGTPRLNLTTEKKDSDKYIMVYCISVDTGWASGEIDINNLPMFTSTEKAQKYAKILKSKGVECGTSRIKISEADYKLFEKQGRIQ